MAFVDDVLAAAEEFFRAPFQDLSLLWQLIPIFLIWILMEWYFGMYKSERLGWNSAVGNGVSLFWIGITSMQHVFASPELKTIERITVLSFIIAYSLFVVYTAFKHRIPARYAFLIAAPTPIYFSSYLVLLYAHNTFSFSIPMIVAIVIIFGLLLVVDKIVRSLIPAAEDYNPDTDDIRGNDNIPTSAIVSEENSYSTLPPNTGFDSTPSQDSFTGDSSPSSQTATTSYTQSKPL